MFGTDCGFAEWIVILIMAVIVFGPKGLPDVIRKIGRFMGMVRHASDEFKAQVMAMDRQLQETAERELKPVTDAASELTPAEPPETENGDPPLPPGPEAYDPTYEAFYAAQAPAPEEEESAPEEPVEKEPTA